MLLFVTGTGTDVGKTVLSAALCTGLAELGFQTTYWKPVQSGLPEDVETVKAHVPSSVAFAPSHAVYSLPASPDQAAAAEEKCGPSVSELTRRAEELSSTSSQEWLVVEGAGGLLVPLNQEGDTWADFLVALGACPIVAAHSGLGTLNHSSLTLEALAGRDLPARVCVLMGPLHQGNMDSLARMQGATPLFAFPHLEGLSAHPSWRSWAVKVTEVVVHEYQKKGP